MKKVLKRAVAALMFVGAFLFVGGAKVNAGYEKMDVETWKNNTTIGATSASYTIENDKYYIIKDKVDGEVKEENQVFTLKAVDNKKHMKQTTVFFLDWFNQGVYEELRADVTVVKCKEYISANDTTCKTWLSYEYSSDANATMEALTNGLTVNLASEFAETQLTEVNGVKLSDLNSIHGTTKTYFVIVRYQGKTSSLYTDPDLFKVVLSSQLTAMKVTNTLVDGVAKVKITSGSPISYVKYFSQSAEVVGEYNFEELYDNSAEDSKVALLNTVAENPRFENGLFIEEFEVELEAGKNYYMQVQDKAGNVGKAHLNVNSEVDGKPDSQAGVSGQPADSNAAHTKVGRIILIVLIVVLVISLALVIIQKIVDYRKKLY